MRKRHIFNLSIFKGLEPEHENLLVPLITLCHIPQGTTIFKQGQAATHLYVMDGGIVEIIFKPFDGPNLTVSRITRGGVFGWSSTMGRAGYTSAARALIDSEAYRIKGKELQQLCEQFPDTGVVILDRLASAIAEHLECTHNQIMSILNQGMDLGYDLSERGSKNG